MNYLIFGGAGFIGSNLADRLATDGETVTIVDNLSRDGSKLNLAWLQQNHPAIHFRPCDIRKREEIDAVFQEAKSVDVVVHLAAQVAVTTSVTDPQLDFEINALGTFNLLEAVRHSRFDPVFLYASTNKVYGGMEHIGIQETDTRYEYANFPEGIDETCPLDFHSPYGCSKGCADQYIRDYSRIYGLRSVVFRQSAIFGTRQFGVEDQGWVAWFTIAASQGRPITIYGDGKQVRDVLWVDDLVDAYIKAVHNIDALKGEVLNIGGGRQFSISIWTEFGPMLQRALGKEIPVTFSDWRPGDQKVCIMNIANAKKRLNWAPAVSAEEGVERIAKWVMDNQSLFES